MRVQASPINACRDRDDSERTQSVTHPSAPFLRHLTVHTTSMTHRLQTSAMPSPNGHHRLFTATRLPVTPGSCLQISREAGTALPNLAGCSSWRFHGGEFFPQTPFTDSRRCDKIEITFRYSKQIRFLQRTRKSVSLKRGCSWSLNATHTIKLLL